jgi:hypothetical protein
MHNLDLVVFENDVHRMRKYQWQGIQNCLIDMEYMGKDLRQLGFDTDISPGTFEHLTAIATIPNVVCWCRLNRFGTWTGKEVEKAIAAGAQILILPMINHSSEVKEFLRLVDTRAKVCLMLETERAVDLAAEVEGLPFEYAYFGLHDYNISTRNNFIFEPLLDGTVAKIRHILAAYKFGFAGLTDIGKGTPIAAIQFLKELARLDANFVFLRRSFKKDVSPDGVEHCVTEINECWDYNMRRSSSEVENDLALFKETLLSARNNNVLTGSSAQFNEA